MANTQPCQVNAKIGSIAKKPIIIDFLTNLHHKLKKKLPIIFK